MENLKKYLVALAGILVQLGLGISQANAYDLSSDYSAVSNPAGVWSYGAMTSLGGAFTLFNTPATAFGNNGVPVNVWGFGPFAPEIWHNGTASTVIGDGGQGVYPPGTIELLAGGNGVSYAFGVARFTAPQSGIYQLQTSAKNYLNGPSSGDSDFHVLDNGVELFGAQILPSPTAPGAIYSYGANLTLAAGETIDFICGRGLDGNGNASGITLQASLTQVPEPTVLALGSLGVAAIFLARRQK